MINFFKKIDKKIIALLCLGISLRLIYGLLFNQMVDYMNILSLAKSVADTGNITLGFFNLKKVVFEPQLYGKIYYQIIALWLKFLDWLGIIKIKYLFDTKPLTEPQSYMIGLWQWSPPLYQLTVIKLIQFIWDFLFVFFLYKTAKLINKNLAWLSILFWALNPYFMMINYAFFMPEMFMLAAFVGGLYFWLRLFEKNNKDSFLFKTLAIFFLTLGAVIKQVPLLLIPFLMIFLIKRIRDFIIYPFLFLIFYLFLKQGWAEDGYFINKFFLFSKESMGILSHQFNSIPYFLIFYSLILIIFIFKKNLLDNKETILALPVLILSLVYLHEPRFFIQFTIWILPFTFLIGLLSYKYFSFFTLSLFSVVIKGLMNDMYLSPILSPTFGAMYNEFLENRFFIDKFFNYDIFDALSKLIIFIIYLIFIVEIINKILKNKFFFIEILNNIFRELGFDYKKIIIIFFTVYIVSNVIDYKIKSNFILLPQREFQVSTEEIKITKKPIILNVSNPSKRSISSVEFAISRRGSMVYDDYLILDFYKNNEKFLSKKINDYEIGDNFEKPFVAILPKKLMMKNFR